MSLISICGGMLPKSNEWTWTERMKRGSVTCWNRSWMKTRIASARAEPSGPPVNVSQLMSIDIDLRHGLLWVNWEAEGTLTDPRQVSSRTRKLRSGQQPHLRTWLAHQQNTTNHDNSDYCNRTSCSQNHPSTDSSPSSPLCPSIACVQHVFPRGCRVRRHLEKAVGL
jgi:hypothetical protein